MLLDPNTKKNLIHLKLVYRRDDDDDDKSTAGSTLIFQVLMYAEERYKDKNLRVVWILLHLCIKSTRSHGVFSFF